MRRVKPHTGKLWNHVSLLAWAVVLALLLSLILFGAMLAGAYVADEFDSSSSRDGATRADARNM
jgi:hypothetical protein